MDDKDKQQKKLIVLQNLNKIIAEIELSDEEQQLKHKLLELEKKLDGVENVLQMVSQEKPNTIFSDNVFNALIGAIAVTAATSIIAEYFGIPKKDMDDLLS